MRSPVCGSVLRVGYQPTLVTTVTAALQALATTHFAAVLLDYGVSAQTGHSVMPQIQQGIPRPVLILMTGQSWESLADQLTHGAFSAFLAKPFSILTLYDTLARSLQLHGRREDGAPIPPDFGDGRRTAR